jgi:hypothetical protein
MKPLKSLGYSQILGMLWGAWEGYKLEFS